MKVPKYIREAAITGLDRLRLLVRVKNSVAISGKHAHHVTLNFISTAVDPVALINTSS